MRLNVLDGKTCIFASMMGLSRTEVVDTPTWNSTCLVFDAHWGGRLYDRVLAGILVRVRDDFARFAHPVDPIAFPPAHYNILRLLA